MSKLKFDSTLDLLVQVREQGLIVSSILNCRVNAFLTDDRESYYNGNSALNSEKVCWNSILSFYQFENLSVVARELNLGADKLKGR